MVVGDVGDAAAEATKTTEDDLFADFGNPKPKLPIAPAPPVQTSMSPPPQTQQVERGTLSPTSQLLHSSPSVQSPVQQSIPPPQPVIFTPQPFSSPPSLPADMAGKKAGGGPKKLGTKLGVKKAALDFDAIEKQAKEDEEKLKKELSEQQVAAALAQANIQKQQQISNVVQVQSNNAAASSQKPYAKFLAFFSIVSRLLC